MRGVLMVIQPHGEITATDIDAVPTTKQLQEAVGGTIEIVPDFHGVVHNVHTHETLPAVAFCNEEGKLNALPLNVLATAMWHDAAPFDISDVLVGPVVIIGGDDELLGEL